MQFSKHKFRKLVDQLRIQLQNLHISSKNISLILYQLYHQKQIHFEDASSVQKMKFARSRGTGASLVKRYFVSHILFRKISRWKD